MFGKAIHKLISPPSYTAGPHRGW